jgi:hypothetical protein
LFSDPNRIVRGQQEDSGAHSQTRGSRGDRGHEGQRIALIARHEMVMANRRCIETFFLGNSSELEGLLIGIGRFWAPNRWEREGKAH